MKTLLTTSPDEAAAIIRRGGVVAFPTETVYGLGADLFNEAAVRKVFEAKQRPADNPLIAHVSRLSQLDELAAEVTASARTLIDAFFPGPLTVVLEKADRVPYIATAGLETIAVRMPGRSITADFLCACDTPVVAPSANLSGRPSPTTWQAVLEDLDGKIDCILQSDPAEIGLESTVVDCTSPEPTVLRKGAISIERLRDVIPGIREYVPDGSEAVRSPGLKHRHYSPTAKVVLVDAGASGDLAAADAFIGLNEPQGEPILKLVCGSVEEYAASVFEFFRECDRRAVKRIVCESVLETGIGAALMDRLRRAAAE